MSTIQFQPLDVHQVPLAGRNLIEASAGTGKTFNITGLYARLILGATDATATPRFDLSRALLPEQILVVTFTKAATAELKDRIRTRLAQLAQTLAERTPFAVNGEPEAFCSQVWQQITEQGQDPAPLLEQLRLALATLDCAAISTIHSFCQRLLTEQAFEAGFDFDRTMVRDESEVLAQIARDFWRSDVYPAEVSWATYLAEHNITVDTLARLASQLAKLDPAVLLPLPAASTLEQIEQRWQAALARCHQSWQPTEVAAILRAGLSVQKFKKTAKLDFAAEPAWLDQFAAFFAQPKQPLPRQFALLAQSKLNDSLLAKFVKQGDMPPQHAFFTALDDLLDSQKSRDADLELYFNHWLLRFGEVVRQQLALRKAQAGQMSFDDSLTMLARALRDPQRAEHLIAKVRLKYRAALVDEFQDTDPTQFTIINSLFGATSDQAEPLPFFMVGDPKQAIYAFRGADVYAYLHAREQASGRYSIDTNYRSDAPIIAFVNALFAPETAFIEEKITHPHIQAKQAGASKLQVRDERKAVHAFVFDGYKAAKAEQLCHQGVAQEIANLLRLAQAGHAQLGERALAPGDIAVLVSSHQQASQMRRALSDLGVPSVSQSRQSVFDSDEARGLLALLQAANEPANSALLRRALVSSIVGLSVPQLQALIADDAAWLAQVERLQILRDEWRKAGFMVMFRRWLVESRTPARLLAFADGERRLTNLLHVAELIQNETRARPSPALLLAWLDRQVAEPDHSAESQQMRLESDADRVKIVTIHASKGLEYPIVFCPYAWKTRTELVRDQQLVAFHDEHEQLWVDAGTSERAAAIDRAQFEAKAEQMRLLYVALTRAKHRLYLAYPAFEKLHASSKSGMQNAPLAQVLYHEQKPLNTQIGECTLDEIQAAFTQLGDVSVSAWPIERAAYQPERRTQQKLSAAVWLPRPLAAPWRMVSFSGLSRGQAKHSESGADHDAAAIEAGATQLAPDLPLRFTFKRGADAGTALHGMFEHWDFSQVDRQGWQIPIAAQLQRAGLLAKDADLAEQDEGMLPELANWLGEVIDTPLGNVGFALRDLSKKQRLNEWPFLMHCPKLNLAAFCRVLAQPEFGLPAEFIAASSRLKPEQAQAYLNGVIDLVCIHQGRYFIADYKSNYLGADFADYGRAALTEAMADAHYYLQYLLYVIAWHRHMQSRMGDAYDYQRDFGGVLYLFIRGMHPQAGENGIWFDKPSAALIYALNQALGGV
ncbi:exodeoxyribonuclease V subunit beta [Chitinibacter fontanus]|uniref:RecBCD enzyme subunit RecB n=1 Tax=Chitinibacter fontanus TaxID=1737446 RepID=A0A7D5V7N9_9NEIS|nr:exodeoxyribonuclease V subunit beta [Chitinibacter fontanus]QLI80154.1 exodeoxyribonuclease V subunit beta [Chitinibacter fontanus]